jgi:hypothetical protein
MEQSIKNRQFNNELNYIAIIGMLSIIVVTLVIFVMPKGA